METSFMKSCSLNFYSRDMIVFVSGNRACIVRVYNIIQNQERKQPVNIELLMAE